MSSLSTVGGSRLEAVSAHKFAVGDRCLCFCRNKRDEHGRAVELIGHAVLGSGASLSECVGHVVHKKCFLDWIKHAVFRNGQPLEVALRCFSCQRGIDGKDLFGEDLNKLKRKLEVVDRAQTFFKTIALLKYIVIAIGIFTAILGSKTFFDVANVPSLFSVWESFLDVLVSLLLGITLLEVVHVFSNNYWAPQMGPAFEDG